MPIAGAVQHQEGLFSSDYLEISPSWCWTAPGGADFQVVTGGADQKAEESRAGL